MSFLTIFLDTLQKLDTCKTDIEAACEDPLDETPFSDCDSTATNFIKSVESCLRNSNIKDVTASCSCFTNLDLDADVSKARKGFNEYQTKSFNQKNVNNIKSLKFDLFIDKKYRM